MRISNKLLEDIKNQLMRGEVSLAKSVLETAKDISILEVFKEQKLLFIQNNRKSNYDLINIFDLAIDKFKGKDPFHQFKVYVSFVKLLSEALEKVSKELNIKLESLNKKSLEETIIIASLLIDNSRKYFLEEYHSFLEKTTKDASHDVNAEINAYALHMLNARDNDLNFAISNMINQFAIKNGVTIGVEGIEDEETIILYSDLATISSLQVSYQWIIDKVSYSEWNIEEITVGDKPKIKFSIADKRLDFSREIGIRSDLVHIHIKKNKDRWLKRLLKPFGEKTIDEILNHYEKKISLIFYSNSAYNGLKSDLYKSLDLLSAEDEMLVLYSNGNPSIIATYLIAVTFMCYYLVVNFCKENMSKNYQSEFISPEVPIDIIRDILLKSGYINHEEYNKQITNFILSLPVSQHYDIIQKYNFDFSNKIIGFPPFAKGNWTATVKANLYKGGEVANSVGNAWEKYIANIFKDYGWKVVGIGLKVNRELPDIDILVLKDDLLLVIQVKTVYGTGINTFEQWKSRTKIIKGANQAFKIKTYLQKDNSLLKKWLSKSEIYNVKIIENIVVTNSSIFNGWNVQNIPIVSLGSIIQILKGAYIKFTSSTGKVLSTKRYIDNPVDTNTFVRFIKHPLDWLLANDTLQYYHRVQESKYIIFMIPTIEREDGTTEIDIISVGRSPTN